MKTNKKKKILVLCPYPMNCAPSQRLKFEQYYNYFEENGFQVTVSSFVTKQFWKILYKEGYFFKKAYFTLIGYFIRFLDLFRLYRYDIVYVHLWVTPLGPPLFERLVKFFSKKIIYDIDDMVFLGHSSDANKSFKALKGTQKMIFLMRIADHVITCTPVLDKFVHKFNPKTTDISSTINTDTYKIKEFLTFNKPIIIGWSGSHSTSIYLKLLEPVFQELLNKGIEFKVLVIGNKDFSFENKNIKTEAISWNLENEVNDLMRFDIGVYPLPFEQWVYGKSGLKALQYMALGIPTIATAIGANYRIINHGKNGFLVEKNDIQKWVEYILHIINDIDFARELGKNARKTVLEKFSVEANKEIYLNVLKSV
ncbi:MAG TPA: glycosyltransferase family 4 protein [Bacteroidales bacterium]|nr:glycosyltransferase family 4 protein [Bacteroidales bacterium]